MITLYYLRDTIKKSGIISGKFFTLAQIFHKSCQIIMYPDHLLFMRVVLRIVIYFGGILSQNENLSEIKLPLDINQIISM